MVREILENRAEIYRALGETEALKLGIESEEEEDENTVPSLPRDEEEEDEADEPISPKIDLPGTKLQQPIFLLHQILVNAFYHGSLMYGILDIKQLDSNYK